MNYDPLPGANNTVFITNPTLIRILDGLTVNDYPANESGAIGHAFPQPTVIYKGKVFYRQSLGSYYVTTPGWTEANVLRELGISATNPAEIIPGVPNQYLYIGGTVLVLMFLSGKQ